ncbi:hypothetical protein ACJRO7_020919 [Eucalyptus globulus]|uniref:NPH3 domain-containing protein n=1 Tax=Eucalyptus globulus TaxID=34317 RepID=A0ABD3KI42_EUCGL
MEQQQEMKEATVGKAIAAVEALVGKAGFTWSWLELKDEPSTVQAKDQRMIIESLIGIIASQKDSVTCSFLLRLLQMANMLKVAPALATELEKWVGMQFEQATLADLLIPLYNKSETLYNVDLVQRLLEHFPVQEQMEGLSSSWQSSLEEHGHDSA